MIRMMFVNRRFERGGAERQLIELAKNLDKSRFDVCVTTFYEGGALYPQIETIPGVRLVNLRKRGRWHAIGFLGNFWRTMRECRPQIVVGYMSVANLLSLAAGRLNGSKVVWAVRNSNMEMARYDLLSRAVTRLELWLAKRADLVIFNSRAGHDHYVRRGFPEKTGIVIPNGIDTDYFRPDSDGRQAVRREWNVGENDALIGLVARLDPMKDHLTFLNAAADLARERADVRFACIGDGTSGYREELIKLAGRLNLGKKVIWVGGRDDMRQVYNALDVMSLSSAFGEGFPNVIGEAMACGVPCVVTDVGDAARVVGGTGFVIPPRNSALLAAKWKEMLDRIGREREATAQAVREWIVEHFSSKSLAARTEAALGALID